MGHLLEDVRLALRALRRNPGFGAAALLTLALGIGGTCAVFSVVNDIFLRPLPFRDESRLLRLRDSARSETGIVNVYNMVGEHFLALAGQTRTLVALSAQQPRSATLTRADPPEHVDAVLASPGSFQTLGIRPALGRGFSPDEESVGEDAGVALIGDALWRRRFGADASILDRTVEVDGRPLRIAGVMPPGYRFPYDAEVWLPLKVSATDPADFAVFARMAPGATLAQVRAELETIAARLPRDNLTPKGFGFEANALRASLVADRDRVAVALLVVLALFLLLACANIAMLLLARSAARQKEFAIRGALGASPWRQASQLLTESATLAVLGGALGLVLALWIAPALGLLVPSNLSLQLGMQEARLDARVPAFAFLLSLVTALAAGLLPALQASRPDLEGVLRGSAPGADPVRRRRLLGSFVSAQIALGVVLLCGAGLVIENFRLLRGRPLGFDERGLYTAQLLLPERRYGDQLSRGQFVEQLQARLAAIPGVEGAGLVTVNPLRGGTWVAPMSVEGRGEMREMVNHRLIAPGTLEAMKVPLLRGRRLLARETEPVALVSARLAARYWPGEDPLGQRVRIAREGRPWMTVVGVVGDVHDAGEVHETWYLPYALNAASPAAAELNLMVRSPLGEEAVSRAVRKALAEVDPLLSLQDFAAMSRVRAENLAPDRLGAGAVSAFALLGLLLAALGTYAVVAYALARREREIGIRLALGAEPARVLRMLLREGAIRAAAGVAVGLGATFALHRILASLLPEVRTMDLRLTFGVALLFLMVATVATWLPGRRALGIDPVISLRAE